MFQIEAASTDYHDLYKVLDRLLRDGFDISTGQWVCGVGFYAHLAKQRGPDDGPLVKLKYNRAEMKLCCPLTETILGFPLLQTIKPEYQDKIFFVLHAKPTEFLS